MKDLNTNNEPEKNVFVGRKNLSEEDIIDVDYVISDDEEEHIVAEDAEEPDAKDNHYYQSKVLKRRQEKSQEKANDEKIHHSTNAYLNMRDYIKDAKKWDEEHPDLDDVGKFNLELADLYTAYINNDIVANGATNEIITEARYDDPKQTEAAHINDPMYNRILMMASYRCMSGNVEGIVSCLSMNLAAMAVNPTYRQFIKDKANELMLPFIERQAQKYPDTWGNKCEHIKNRLDIRNPWTPETASLMEIRYAKQAYNDMRQPGANISSIQNKYDTAIEELRRQAMEDGISKEDLLREKRKMVGMTSEKDPTIKEIFKETALGEIERDMPRMEEQIVMGPNGPKRQLVKFPWHGEYRFTKQSEMEDTVAFDQDFTLKTPNTVSIEDYKSAFMDMAMSMISDKMYLNGTYGTNGEEQTMSGMQQARDRMDKTKERMNMYMKSMMADGYNKEQLNDLLSACEKDAMKQKMAEMQQQSDGMTL